MTKYYVGYKQGNNEYVYVAGIDNSNVRVSTTLEGGIGFTDVKLAEAFNSIVGTLVANQDYQVLKVTVDIKEVG